ncbi:MAG: oligosaccharide flippase family protein [Gammaproteobacteria bacterium]|nr:oligosaccharide flippase family protein [Rhodocyclaceae bacterium]MBU3910521.1 oligosaccharide flippase family protein [Gammaproteobacteria bacterium]MBU4005002.1 oligosaccharide flippase family protein [Gammaproteobacteria bacterium]MBU4020595.1 oligosaccharide flippase family protein [Gammaproteobacteria bacterium]MBU4095671.1 oligosaccharide flippase family protein [Gammaproteobacteria bacterium]
MLKRNLIANYLGQGWVALMSLAFIPLYIKYLGIESYGLIGLFAVLQAWLSLLDMGMTPTLGREMARFTGGTHTAQSIRDLLRSIEVVALGMAFFIAAGIWAASGWLASDWLRAESLSAETVAQAFTVMGVVAALRFVEGIYRSSIVGLQRQVLFNVVNSAMATLRGFGAVAILVWVSPTIGAFFIWQGIVSILTLFTLGWITYHALPTADQAGRFSLEALQGVGRFAGGMMGITFLSLLLIQVDKIVLSKLLNLSEYGYYMLASAVAGALYVMIYPIGQAWFPRLTELYARHDQPGLIATYHQGAQLVSVTMGSAAVVMMVFAEQILHLWTQDAELARRTALLVSLLALGNLLNGLMWIPCQAQLAHGWTGLTARINIIAVLVIVPAILWATPRYGAEGAAWVWICLNTGYVLIGVHFMYRKILQAEKWCWYKNDIIQPLGAAAITALIVHKLIPAGQSTAFAQLLTLAGASGTILMMAGMFAPSIRQKMRAQVSQWMRFGKLRGP